MRSKASVSRGKGKAPAPRRKVQEGRQQASSEDEVDVENTMDKDDEPTYREQTFNLSPFTRTLLFLTLFELVHSKTQQNCYLW